MSDDIRYGEERVGNSKTVLESLDLSEERELIKISHFELYLLNLLNLHLEKLNKENLLNGK